MFAFAMVTRTILNRDSSEAVKSSVQQ